METIIINSGPLSSTNNLQLYIGAKISEILQLKRDGRTPDVRWDLSNSGQIHIKELNSYKHVNVSISALTSLISIATRLRCQILGYPPITKLKHDPKVLGFFFDTNFKEHSEFFETFQWEPLMFSNIKKNYINPNTKIEFYDDIPFFQSNTNKSIISNWKNEKRVEVKHSLKSRFSSIFDNEYFPYNWNSDIETILLRVSAELAVNGLLHGEDITFIGMQRSSSGITISICDSGNGLIHSLKKNYSFLKNSRISYIHALVLASIINRKKAGLYKGISEVLSLGGWVTISSGRCEVRWEQNLWNTVIENYDLPQILKDLPSIDFINPFQIKGQVPKDRIKNGYYKYYEHPIPGVKLSFHLPFNR